MNSKLTVLLGLALSLLAATPALAASARTAPKPIETPSPGYPAVLEDSGKAGRAVIEILVRADGTVGETRVVSTDHEAFAAAALEVLPRWRFEPGTKDGAIADTRVSVPFVFAPPMPQQLNALFKRKVYQPAPEGVLTQKEFGKRPKPVKAIRPAYPKTLLKSKVEEDVEVNFIIAPDGTTINPDIVKPPRKEFILPALTAVANATFPPPMKDGKPVYVASSVKLKFAPPEPPRRGGGGGGGGGGGDFGGGGFGGGGGGDFGGGGGSPD